MPTVSEKKKVCSDVTRHLERSPKLVELLEFLFRNELQPNGGRPLTDSDLGKLYPDAGSSKPAARQTLKRLRHELETYFGAEEYDHAWTFEIGAGHRLQWKRAGQPKSAERTEDYVRAFWKPILDSDVRFVYGEPQFFQDKRHTYFRNPRVTKSDGVKFFDYLNIEGSLRANTTYVPAGVISAMLQFVRSFQSLGIRIESTALRPNVAISGHDRDEHLIVLGPPSTNRLITILEETLPMRTTEAGVVVQGQRKPYKDVREEVPRGPKWAVLTRHEHHRYRGKFVTILSGEYSRTVEAIAEFLTRDADLKVLLDQFTGARSFPPAFQVLFEVRMRGLTGEEPWIGAVHPRRVVILDNVREADP